MNSIQVTAQLFTAAADFTLRAGDQVMVVGGVLIGVYTGQRTPRAPEAQAGPEAAAAAAPARGRPPHAKPAKPVRASHLRSQRVANAKLRAVFKVEILRLLPLGGTPVPVKFLAMRLGVGKRTTEYHQLREALRELAEDGHIGIEKQQGNFGYFLPPAPAPAPTAAPAPVDQQAPDLQAAAE